jgi:hypothetical protein
VAGGGEVTAADERGLEYDFFLAHAGPDIPDASRLDDLLAGRARCFLAERSIRPGARWPADLQRAQRASAATVVLVSSRTAAAVHVEEEVTLALDMPRRTGRRHDLIGVYLENVEGPWGLASRHSIFLSEGHTLESVADELARLVRHDVYVAHSGADEGTARALAALLGVRWRCVVAGDLPAVSAELDVPPGTATDARRRGDVVAGSGLVVVVASEASEARPEVRVEAELARARGVGVLVVAAHGRPLGGELAGLRPAAGVTVLPGTALEELADEIRQEASRLLAGRDRHRPTVIGPAGPPAGPPVPDADPELDRVERAYLAWLVDQHATIRARLGELDVAAPLADAPVPRRIVADGSAAFQREQEVSLLRARPRSGAAPPAGAGVTPAAVAERPLPTYLSPAQHVDRLDLTDRVGRRGDELVRACWRAIVLGDPGSGKTTFGRRVAREQAVRRAESAGTGAGHRPAERRLPVLCRASRLVAALEGEPAAPLEELAATVGWDGPPVAPGSGDRLASKVLRRLVRRSFQRQELLLVVDGLDEVATVEQRALLARRLADVAERSGVLTGRPDRDPGVQVLVTSRIVGYHAVPLDERYQQHLIAPLDLDAARTLGAYWLDACRRHDQAVPATVAAMASAFDDLVADAASGLAGLAGNPFLLVSLLSTLATGMTPNRRRRGGRWVRADIYRRMLDDALRRAAERLPGVEPAPLRRLQCRLAYDLHRVVRTGVVAPDRYRDLVAEALDAPGMPEVTVAAAVAQLEAMGLVTDRGQDSLGFLHLTVEEYLAGLWLAGGGSDGGGSDGGGSDGGGSDGEAPLPEPVRGHLGDPRWVEPIRLALGDRSRTDPDRFRALVAALLGGDGPGEAAVLVVQALADLVVLPADLARDLARAVLGGPEGSDVSADPDVVTSVFRSLAVPGAAAVDEAAREAVREVLRDAVASEAPAVMARAAAVVGELRLADRSLLLALLEAQHRDRAEHGWHTVRALLRTIVPPADELPEPEPEAVAAVVDGLDADDRQVLATMSASVPPRPAPTGRGLRRSARGVPIPTDRLPFRAALAREEGLRRAVESSPPWRRLVLCLYGAIRFDDAVHWREERQRLVAIVQSPTTGAEERWRAAARLDSLVVPRLAALDVRPSLLTEAIVVDSPLTSDVLDWLDRGLTPDAAAAAALEIWADGAAGDDRRADALVAWAALGTEGPEGVRAVLRQETAAPVLARVRWRLDRAAFLLHDTLAGLPVGHVARELQAKAARLTGVLHPVPPAWTVVRATAALAGVRGGGFDRSPDAPGPALACTATPYDDGQNLAVFLDIAGKALGSDTVDGLAGLLGEVQAFGGDPPVVPDWPLDPLAPRRGDRLAEALTAVGLLPLRLAPLRLWALGRLAAHARAAGFGPELLQLAAGGFHGDADLARDVLRRIRRPDPADAADPADPADLADPAAEPAVEPGRSAYGQLRALLWITAGRGWAGLDAATAARDVLTAHQRLRLGELAHELGLPGPSGTELVALAAQEDDPVDRARSLARALRWVEAGAGAAAEQACLDALRAVPAGEAALVLAALPPLTEAGEAARAALVATLPGEALRALATGRFLAPLLDLERELGTEGVTRPVGPDVTGTARGSRPVTFSDPSAFVEELLAGDAERMAELLVAAGASVGPGHQALSVLVEVAGEALPGRRAELLAACARLHRAHAVPAAVASGWPLDPLPRVDRPAWDALRNLAGLPEPLAFLRRALGRALAPDWAEAGLVPEVLATADAWGEDVVAAVRSAALDSPTAAVYDELWTVLQGTGRGGGDPGALASRVLQASGAPIVLVTAPPSGWVWAMRDDLPPELRLDCFLRLVEYDTGDEVWARLGDDIVRLLAGVPPALRAAGVVRIARRRPEAEWIGLVGVVGEALTELAPAGPDSGGAELVGDIQRELEPLLPPEWPLVWAVLTAAGLCHDLRADERDEPVPRAWPALGDPATRPAALATIRGAAREACLPMGDAAVAAIGRLIADGDGDAAAAALAVVTTDRPRPELAAWRRSPHQGVADLATLLSLEAGVVDGAALAALPRLMADHGDAVRLRTALATSSVASGRVARPRFPASALGAEGLAALANLVVTARRTDRGAGTDLGWALSDVIHDDPALLAAALGLVRAGRDVVHELLHNVRQVQPNTPAGLVDLVAELDDPGDQALLLRSLEAIADHPARSGTSADDLETLAPAVRRLVQEADDEPAAAAIRLLARIAPVGPQLMDELLADSEPTGTDADAVAAAACEAVGLLLLRPGGALAARREAVVDQLWARARASDRRLAVAALAALVGVGEDVERSAAALDAESVLEALLAALPGFLVGDAFEAGVVRAARFVRHPPGLTGADATAHTGRLLRALLDMVSPEDGAPRRASGHGPGRQLTDALWTLAALADDQVAAVRRAIDDHPGDLRDHLVALAGHEAWHVRHAASRLVARIGRGDAAAVTVVLDAADDTEVVREAALRSIVWFDSIDDDGLAVLLDALQEGRAARSHAALCVLEVLLRGGILGAGGHTRALAALRAMGTDPARERVVVAEMHGRVRGTGSVGEHCHAALTRLGLQHTGGAPAPAAWIDVPGGAGRPPVRFAVTSGRSPDDAVAFQLEQHRGAVGAGALRRAETALHAAARAGAAAGVPLPDVVRAARPGAAGEQDGAAGTGGGPTSEARPA